MSYGTRNHPWYRRCVGDGRRERPSARVGAGAGWSAMRLNAGMLDTWDRCERRFAFSKKWESKSISPLGLLYHALESALAAADPEQAAKDATMERVRDFELASGEHNTFMMI